MIYMSEVTVRAAKLHCKSDEELRKAGVGHDQTGYFLLASVNLTLPTPKTGALASFRAVVNVATAVSNVVEAMLGAKASDKEIARRRNICTTCFEVDASGRRLFRFVNVEAASCGQPMDPRAPNAKVLRDPVVDGCGCWLQDKWVGQGQACPRGKWGPEKVPEPPRSYVKRRCCGQ